MNGGVETVPLGIELDGRIFRFVSVHRDGEDQISPNALIGRVQGFPGLTGYEECKLFHSRREKLLAMQFALVFPIYRLPGRPSFADPMTLMMEYTWDGVNSLWNWRYLLLTDVPRCGRNYRVVQESR